MDRPNKIYVRDWGEHGIAKMWTYSPSKKRNEKDLVYINKDALCEKVNDLINALQKQNPNPLGDINQSLAASEIEALKAVLDIIEELN